MVIYHTAVCSNLLLTCFLHYSWPIWISVIRWDETVSAVISSCCINFHLHQDYISPPLTPPLSVAQQATQIQTWICLDSFELQILKNAATRGPSPAGAGTVSSSLLSGELGLRDILLWLMRRWPPGPSVQNNTYIWAATSRHREVIFWPRINSNLLASENKLT